MNINYPELEKKNIQTFELGHYLNVNLDFILSRCFPKCLCLGLKGCSHLSVLGVAASVASHKTLNIWA